MEFQKSLAQRFLEGVSILYVGLGVVGGSLLGSAFGLLISRVVVIIPSHTILFLANYDQDEYLFVSIILFAFLAVLFGVLAWRSVRNIGAGKEKLSDSFWLFLLPLGFVMAVGNILAPITWVAREASLNPSAILSGFSLSWYSSEGIFLPLVSFLWAIVYYFVFSRFSKEINVRYGTEPKRTVPMLYVRGVVHGLLLGVSIVSFLPASLLLGGDGWVAVVANVFSLIPLETSQGALSVVVVTLVQYGVVGGVLLGTYFSISQKYPEKTYIRACPWIFGVLLFLLFLPRIALTMYDQTYEYLTSEKANYFLEECHAREILRPTQECAPSGFFPLVDPQCLASMEVVGACVDTHHELLKLK